MRQLSSLDAQFLAIEDGRRTGHVGALAIYDPSTAPRGKMDHSTMTELVGERLHLLPPLRWRVMELPLQLDYPYWVNDDDFDLSYHVREGALPTPGSDDLLAELVSRLHSRVLDRSRPLWEMYVISGLVNGLVAVYTKVHHAVVDAMSGAELADLLLDVTPNRQVMPEPDPAHRQRSPGVIQRWSRAVTGLPRYPARALRAAPRALRHLDESTVAALPLIRPAARVAGYIDDVINGEVRRREPLIAPKTAFNGRISASRRFVFGRLTLSRINAIKESYEVTADDVVVSLCAGAVRRWLLHHRQLPDRPLIAHIPVSVRAREQRGAFGNLIHTMAAPLFTDVADPIARLTATAASLKEMKDRRNALPSDLPVDVNHLVPPALFSRAAGATFALATSSLGRPASNVVVSHVPGPQTPLYCGGARLVAHYPVSVITDGLGLNITAMSYDGHLDVGIVADRRQMPDVATLVEGLDHALHEVEHYGRRRDGVHDEADSRL
jgi:diacylglycerol O-acyltransferase / wax synthase